MANTLAPKKEEVRPFFEDFFEMSPFAELPSFRRRMNSLLDSVMRPTTYQDFAVPFIDVYNKNGSYTVEVALPGLQKKDVDIEVEGNCLTVSGKYAKEEVDKEKRYQYRELRRGSFSRTVMLPEDIEPDKVTAFFDHGILKIEIPLLRPAQPKKISIN